MLVKRLSASGKHKFRPLTNYIHGRVRPASWIDVRQLWSNLTPPASPTLPIPQLHSPFPFPRHWDFHLIFLPWAFLPSVRSSQTRSSFLDPSPAAPPSMGSMPYALVLQLSLQLWVYPCGRPLPLTSPLALSLTSPPARAILSCLHALFSHNHQLPKMLLTVPPSPKDLEPVPLPQSPLPGMFIHLIPAPPGSQPVSRISLSYSHPGHLQSQTSCHPPLCSFCQLCAVTRGNQGQQWEGKFLLSTCSHGLKHAQSLFGWPTRGPVSRQSWERLRHAPSPCGDDAPAVWAALGAGKVLTEHTPA